MTHDASDQAGLAPIEAMQDRLDFAKKLQILTNRIHGTDNIAQIMLDLSAEICELFLCERLTLYVINKEQGTLVSKVKTGLTTDQELVLPIDRRSIAGFVAQSRSTVRITDLDDPEELARIDPELRFNAEIDRASGFRSRQMLAAPLLQGTAKELVGVLQLINQRVDGRFDSVAEEGLEALTATLALALFQRIKTGALIPKRYEVLTSQGVISAQELELANRWAQRKQKDLELVLAEDFQIPLAAIGETMAKQANMPYQPLPAKWRVDPELAKKLNRATCQQQQWLPLSIDRNVLVAVTPEANNRVGAETMHRTFPYNQSLLRFTTRTEFARMFAQYFP